MSIVYYLFLFDPYVSLWLYLWKDLKGVKVSIPALFSYDLGKKKEGRHDRGKRPF